MRLQELFFKEVKKHCSKVDRVTVDCQYSKREEAVDFWVWSEGEILANTKVRDTRKKTHKQQVAEATKECIADGRMR